MGLGTTAVIKYQFGNESQYADCSEIDNFSRWFGF